MKVTVSKLAQGIFRASAISLLLGLLVSVVPAQKADPKDPKNAELGLEMLKKVPG